MASKFVKPKHKKRSIGDSEDAGKNKIKSSKNTLKKQKTSNDDQPTPISRGSGAKKFISADDLKWNSVKINQSVNIVEGFFGLEEIEGVDVQYVDGKAHFVVKDQSKLKTEEEKAQEEENGRVKKNQSLLTEKDEEEIARQEEEREEKHDNNDGDDEDDGEEFTAFSDREDDGAEIEQEALATVLQEEEAEAEDDNINIDDDDDDDDDDEVDEDLLADYKENLKTSKLTDILDEDEDLDSVELPQTIIENWSDLSLSKYTLNSLAKLAFNMPTPIQKACIPAAIADHDVIGKASTGSGKTLGYGLPILEKFLLRLKENGNKPLDSPVGIVFTPTRELAKQVHSHFVKVVENYPLKDASSVGKLIVSITGGLSIQKQERLLSYNPGLIIATPGRLLELLELDNNDILNKISKIEILTLDEADRLLQDGHFGELEKIIEILYKVRKTHHLKKWQTFVFSATFSKTLFSKLDKNVNKKKQPAKNKKQKKNGKKNHNDDPESETINDDHEIIEFLKTKLQFREKNPKIININPKEVVSGTISEALIECDATNRDLYLYYFLTMYTGTTLIFTNSIDSVKRLNSFLKFLHIKCFSIHSSMLQKQRLKNLENFQKSCVSEDKKQTVVLLATDVAARGLDIPNIDHVVHYHLPRSADLYIHRSGRTGRAGSEGVSIMLCSPQEVSGPLRRLRRLLIEESMKMDKKPGDDPKDRKRALFTRFQNLTDDDVKLLPIEVSILDQLRERGHLASELAESDVSKSSLSKEDSWVSKIAEALEVDDLSDFEDDALTKKRNKKVGKTLDSGKSRAKKYELEALLKQKLRIGGSKKYLSNGLVNMADIMVRGEGHDNIIGYDNVNVIDVIKKSRRHQDRVLKLQEQKKLERQQKEDKKDAKKKKKDAKKTKKRKKEEEMMGGGDSEGEDFDDVDDDDDDEE
ncbi:putative ATP-dependent RNA helicase [Saccharomycopsis crataegensis]|uniref:ATP-dependent RNA helicase n=1 Tax=Saccharomycopsis crataegensis TaxID=43959 RepID=A0AAV5QVQ8_9ASCO|nr:putative ATP-dependent RNA helicase [Saccharomycopsis crataegensis]